MEIRKPIRPTDKRPPVTPPETCQERFTNQEIIQLAAAIFEHNPGIYVGPSSHPENAYQQGRMIGKVIAGAVDGFIEGFSEKCTALDEDK